MGKWHGTTKHVMFEKNICTTTEKHFRRRDCSCSSNPCSCVFDIFFADSGFRGFCDNECFDCYCGCSKDCCDDKCWTTVEYVKKPKVKIIKEVIKVEPKKEVVYKKIEKDDCKCEEKCECKESCECFNCECCFDICIWCWRGEWVSWIWLVR